MSSFHSAMAETSGSGVPAIKTLNIASDVNATAKRYCRFGQDCASRLRFPLGACFCNYDMHKLDIRPRKEKRRKMKWTTK